MISGKTIICFASGWDYHPTSKHHIMRGLSANNNIVWVNWHASRRPSVGMADLRSILSRVRQIGRGPRQVSERITVVTPPQVPLPGSALARAVTAACVRRAIRRVLRRLPAQPVQLWSFAPDVGHLVGSFGEELALYYCVDAFGEFAGYDRDLIERCERELMAQSDVVVTTSPPLYEAKRRCHSNVHQLSHGVDHAHLARALEPGAVPADLAALPRPVLGFVGLVGDWVDLDLVAALARRMPGGSLAMIGPEPASRGPCTGLPNVHWLGARDHRVLPEYLRGFDVGLIPFRPVPLAHNANPIKLYEYLAAGVPVVSSSLPAVRPLEGHVWLADGPQAMVAACREALACNAPAQKAERSRLMVAESWSVKLEQLSAIVRDTPARKTQPARCNLPAHALTA